MEVTKYELQYLNPNLNDDFEAMSFWHYMVNRRGWIFKKDDGGFYWAYFSDGEKPSPEIWKYELDSYYKNPKRVSIDNGNSFWTANEYKDELESFRKKGTDNERIAENIWANITEAMDDDLREKIHAEYAPCSEYDFLKMYLEQAECDLMIG